MPIRAPIERWSRNELEERFHNVSDEVKILKQNNQKMEKEIKIMNGRVNLGVGTESRIQIKQNYNEFDELQRSNKVLSQKLKVLKHQLLNYSTALPFKNKTRPNNINNNNRPSTTQLPLQFTTNTIKQKSQQKRINYLKQRPKSSTIENKINQTTETFNNELINNKINNNNNILDNLILENNINEEFKGNELKEIQKDFNIIQNLNLSDELEKGNNTNNRLREITKQNRKIISENEDLRFSLEKNEKKLSTLSKEYDKLVIELTNAKNGYQSQSESLFSFREEFQRRVENSSKTAQISDKELAILREENNSLKSAYDKLISHSLEEENNIRKTLEELTSLRTKLQQNNSDSDYEKQQFEQKLNKLRLQNEQLEKELLLEKDNNNKIINNNNLIIKNEKKQNDNEENNNENKIKIKPTTSGREDLLLDKLFKDVIGIIENDIKFIGNKNNEEIKGLENSRWHKMYEEVYEELEKVRQLLLSEHELNNRLREEIKQKSMENEDLKEKYENKLTELESELLKNNNKTNGLERELKSIIDGKQIFNNNFIFKNNGNNTLGYIESTELSLTISKLILTENCLNLIENKNPTIFIAIEFFDFELQTSQLVNGPEANLNFTSIFELSISDLFIHYIQTEGMNIELYFVKNDMNYKLCSQAIISLKKLLSIKTQTYFKGELSFFSSNENESQKLLAKLYYNIKVPFSLLKALNAQRRRMAAAAIIPLIQNNNINLNEEFETNKLIIQIHRCYNLDKLKGGEKDDNINNNLTDLMSNTYIAYEFFNFPVHMSNLIKNRINPLFEDLYTWKLPINSEAIHKYLLNEDLLIYVFEQNNQNILPSSTTSRSLGYISIPLFPLARNQTIRGTFPLIDRADESITSGASIDISLYWQFAYIFDDIKIISKTEENKQIRLLEDKSKQININSEENKNDNNNYKELKLIKEKEEKKNNQENDLIKKENINSSEEEEQNNELAELELRNNLLSNKIEQKIEKDINLIKEEHLLENINEENNNNYSSSDSSNKISEIIIQSPKSSSSNNSFEENIILNKEEEEEDNISFKSDATYTMDNNILDNNNEINKIKEIEQSFLRELPPIPAQRKSKTIIIEQTNNSPNELINKKVVEFSDPLHSSIPPSSISSFTESIDDSSSHSNISSYELNSKEEEEEDKNKKEKKKQLKNKKRQINIKAIPTTPSIIRIRKEESINENNENLQEEKEPFILNIFIGKLNLIENSSSSILTNQNAYILDHKRVNLLKQWTELNIGISFTLVIEKENNGELDDLCIGEFNLINLINNNYENNNNLIIDNITMRDVDNLTIALLEIGIKYSESLFNKIKDSFTFLEDEEIEEEENNFNKNNSEDEEGIFNV